jgi:hypothetical protein
MVDPVRAEEARVRQREDEGATSCQHPGECFDCHIDAWTIREDHIGPDGALTG